MTQFTTVTAVSEFLALEHSNFFAKLPHYFSHSGSTEVVTIVQKLPRMEKSSHRFWNGHNYNDKWILNSLANFLLLALNLYRHNGIYISQVVRIGRILCST